MVVAPAREDDDEEGVGKAPAASARGDERAFGVSSLDWGIEWRRRPPTAPLVDERGLHALANTTAIAIDDATAFAKPPTRINALYTREKHRPLTRRR